MQHYRSLDPVQMQGVWLTIGSFDGLHLGHQEIIRNLTAEAHQNGASAVVLTFYPHPAEVLRKRDYPFYLTTPEEKAELLGEAGVDVVITHPFNREVAATSAYDFMARLHKHLGLRHLKIGHDFALGRDRAGDAQALSEIGQKLGYSVEQIPPFSLAGQLVSSSRVRFLLGVGQVEEVARMLGRDFSLAGTVVMGNQRGRTIGFPTANLELWKMRAIPAGGVYACRTTINGIQHKAVTNIGVQPTFEAHPAAPRVEAHILDFDGDLYGSSLKVEFIARLRNEQRFDSVQELIAQIQRDVEAARQILA